MARSLTYPELINIPYFKQNFNIIPLSNFYFCNTRYVLDCICRKTDEPVTVVIEQTKDVYNITKVMELAFVHPQLTPVIDVKVEGDFLFIVSKDPDFARQRILRETCRSCYSPGTGVYISQFIEQNKFRSREFFRKAAHFVFVKLLKLLKDLADRNLGLFELQNFAIILQINGGTVTDMTVRRSHVTDAASAADFKSQILTVAKMLNNGNTEYDGRPFTNNIFSSEFERNFLFACKPGSAMTINQLMNMAYIKYDWGTWTKAADDVVDNLQWKVIRNKIFNPEVHTKRIYVKDYILDKIHKINDAVEGSSQFGFNLPVSGHTTNGTYLVDDKTIEITNNKHVIVGDGSSLKGPISIDHENGCIICVNNYNKKYYTFDSLPTKLADDLIAARHALNVIHNEDCTFTISFPTLDTKFNLHCNGFVTLQHLSYETTLSPKMIAAGQLRTLITDNNSRMAFNWAMEFTINNNDIDYYSSEAARKSDVRASKVTGTVVCCRKCYGYIRRDDTGKHVNFNYWNISDSACKDRQTLGRLTLGAKVEFDVVWSIEGFDAINVTFV